MWLCLGSVGRDGISGLLGLRVRHGLKHTGLLERLVCLSRLHMVRVHMLETHARAVQGGMRDDLDGQLVLNDGRDAMLCSSSGHRVGASGAHSHGNNTDGPAHGHTREHVSLAGVVGRSEPVEVSLDDIALLARVVDGGRGQTDANGGDTGCQGQCEARNCGRGGRPRDESRVMLPFSLEFLLVHPLAFLVVFLEIERHLAGSHPHGVRLRTEW